jgi:malonyl-CoA/methylmalonyl-CoA synthetase
VTLNHLFDLSLAARRDTPALEFEGRTFTFGEIDARANRTAQALSRRGLKCGDRLCVQLANCVEMIDLYLACTRLGVIFVPINILYRDRETAHIIQDADPALFLTPADLPALAAETAACDTVRPDLALDGDTPAGIIYTSGTTGASKGAILTHNNFAANAITLLTCWQITAADRLLLVLPLFHVHGLGNGLHCWLASGCRMRLMERFDRDTAAATFLDFQTTLFFGVPTIYIRLLDLPPDTAREIGARMRLFVSGSAPLPAHVLEAFRERFGHTILERYGMSENLMDISNPYIGERRPGSVGLPLPGVSVRLVDGEIQLKGSNVFAGYWRREEATREAFTLDGWFKTGDLADVSPDGYYTLRGRKSDLIISGGFNIYPREIEEFLQEQPEIAEAAVCGRSDPVRGEVPVAFVVLRSAIDCTELESRCRSQFASFKIPREFHTVEKLPRNAMGKMQKHLLRP